MTGERQIGTVLEAACETLRGGAVDPSTAAAYAVTLLFARYAAAAHDERFAGLLARYGGDAARAERALELSGGLVAPRATRLDSPSRRGDDPDRGLGEAIDARLAALAAANPGTLATADGSAFRHLPFAHPALGPAPERTARLRRVLEGIREADLDLRPGRLAHPGAFALAAERLLASQAAETKARPGGLPTPPEVAGLMARLADPQPGDRVCDPFCGSGALLTHAASRLRERHGDAAELTLYGQESHGRRWGLAVQLAASRDPGAATLRRGDSLLEPAFLTAEGELDRFDVVVSHPPFGVKAWGRDAAQDDRFGRFAYGLPTSAKGDFAFLSHLLACGDPQRGRVVALLPAGVLFRGGTEATIRRRIVEAGALEAVVALPPRLLYGTQAASCLLVFDHARARGAGRAGEVLLVDASAYFRPGGRRHVLRAEDVDRVAEVYTRFRAGEPGTGASDGRPAAVVSAEALATQGHNLNVALYVDTLRPEGPVDMAAVGRRLRATREELRAVEERMDAILRDLGME